MQIRKIPRPSTLVILIAAAVLVGLLLIYALTRSTGDENWFTAPQGAKNTPLAVGQATATLQSLPTMRPAGAPIYTPTPDKPHILPPMRTDPDSYTVQAGDSLGRIANSYGVSIQQIVQENGIANPNLLAVGQVLVIPPPTPSSPGSAYKVIPDSELVYGPASVGFDVEAYIRQGGGYLASYREEFGDLTLSGAQIVQQITQDYSMNPRLLLAVLQHQSGWVTDPAPSEVDKEYPLGLPDPQRKDLFRQISWAANQLNRGYYLYRVGGVGTWLLSDGSIVPIDPTINAGTAAVQGFFAALYGRADWDQAVTEQGLFATYNQMFGYPFDYAVEPLLPAGLSQPVMQLPFEPEILWAFTSGPHGAWGDGTAWAALDFAPPGDRPGCISSDDWVVAVADGQILRAENGVVIQDLDGDGYEQTGWVVLYLHIESRERVQPGAYLTAGERIGHPSCEGGVSTGTHVHVARRYNGEWISADQDIPFVLDGWVSRGAGAEYDGYLQRGAQQVEAYAGRNPNNEIQR
jgi:murein DD-endopeptidase MepM/ murein hydrolase activator NlpD